MEDRKTIELAPSVVLGDKTYDKLELREPTAGEIDKAQRITVSPAASTIELIAQVAGVPARVIEKLPISKFNEAAEFLQGFINSAPGTTAS